MHARLHICTPSLTSDIFPFPLVKFCGRNFPSPHHTHTHFIEFTAYTLSSASYLCHLQVPSMRNDCAALSILKRVSEKWLALQVFCLPFYSATHRWWVGGRAGVPLLLTHRKGSPTAQGRNLRQSVENQLDCLLIRYR